MKRRAFIATGMAAGASALMDTKTSMNEGDDLLMWQAAKPATILFDGKALSGWTTRTGGAAEWKIRDGYMEVAPGTGDILTKEVFNDFQLHVEFWLPLM